MQNISEAKFTGAIAFKNGTAALQMQLLVNTIIDKSVNIFSTKRTFPPSQLLDDLDKMLQLSQNFVEYASNKENEEIESNLLEEMRDIVEKLRDVIGQFNGHTWTLSQSQMIAEYMKEIFSRLEKLTEKNEEDHVRKALKQTQTAKSCQASLANGTDYDPSNWQILLKNYNTMQGILLGMMENRASVTKEEERKNEILELKRKTQIISDALPNMCELARSSNFPQELMNKINVSAERLNQYTEYFEEILKYGIECFSSFKHTPIEPEKFGEQLDDLINMIQSGNSEGFMSAARNLTNEVGNIKQRELLENETKMLNEQTKQLLINAKEVLKNNDKENAKKKMNEIAAVLKKNVQDLALQEKQMMNSKKKLSKQATGLGLAMQNMGQVLTNITGNEMVGNSPLFQRTKSDQEMETIENNLGELEFNKGGETQDRIEPTKLYGGDDLDDLEKELDELDSTPNQSSKPLHNSSKDLDDLDDLEKELQELETKIPPKKNVNSPLAPAKKNSGPSKFFAQKQPSPLNKQVVKTTPSTNFQYQKKNSTPNIAFNEISKDTHDFTSHKDTTELDELEMLERELEDL